MIGALRRWHQPRRRRRRAAAPPQPVDLRPFEVASMRAGDAELWTVVGEIDIATTPQLEAVLAAVAAGDGPFVVDLTDVTFMDSTGLSVLLRIDRAARDAGRRLAIVCPEGPARLVLAVSGVEDALPLYATRAAALDAS